METFTGLNWRFAGKAEGSLQQYLMPPMRQLLRGFSTAGFLILQSQRIIEDCMDAHKNRINPSVEEILK